MEAGAGPGLGEVLDAPLPNHCLRPARAAKALHELRRAASAAGFVALRELSRARGASCPLFI